jgi:hypothetical protein
MKYILLLLLFIVGCGPTAREEYKFKFHLGEKVYHIADPSIPMVIVDVRFDFNSRPIWECRYASKELARTQRGTTLGSPSFRDKIFCTDEFFEFELKSAK